MFSGGIAALLAQLFPSRCIGCRVRGSDLCPSCRADLPWLGEAACPLCGAFVPTNARCRLCPRARLSLDGVRVAFRFEGAARTAIHDLKYRRIRRRADLLGGFLADAIERRPLALDVLAPVPLTPGRRRWRGFNQSDLIAAVLGGRLDVPVEPVLLVRQRETTPQVGMSGDARRANVAGAFRCADGVRARGLRVGVVDDVMTTGSTLAACADALHLAGASRVYGIVVARDG